MITQMLARLMPTARVSQKIITILLFSVIVAYGQKQEYKAKGIKWEYDKLEGIETYYTKEPFYYPKIIGRLRIKTDTNGFKTMKFFVLFKTTLDEQTTADGITFYNKDMNRIDYKKEISDVEAEFIPSQVIVNTVTPAGFIRIIMLDLDYTKINLLKDLLKYKKINPRVYDGNKYIEYSDKYVKGVDTLLNLIDIYNKIYDRQLELSSEKLEGDKK